MPAGQQLQSDAYGHLPPFTGAQLATSVAAIGAVAGNLYLVSAAAGAPAAVLTPNCTDQMGSFSFLTTGAGAAGQLFGITYANGLPAPPKFAIAYLTNVTNPTTVAPTLLSAVIGTIASGTQCSSIIFDVPIALVTTTTYLCQYYIFCG